MIATTIRFTLAADTDWDAIRVLLRQRAELYRGVPGLVSKAFLCNPETRDYGGNYVWESRAALDAFFASDLFATAVKKFGQPRIQIDEVAAYLDHGEVHAPG